MQHLIKKQTINLALPKQLDAFGMQHSVSRHYWNDVLPVLEQVFDELSVNDETLHIEQLEIDLGELSEKELMQDNWNPIILLKIRKQLYEKIGKKADVKIYSREIKTLNSCRQWLFYMQKGYLPWNAIRISDSWYNEILEALASDFAIVAELKKLIRENGIVIGRIIHQHSEKFLISLIEILTAENQNDLSKAIGELQEVFSFEIPVPSPSNKDQERRKDIWQQVLSLSVNEDNLKTSMLIERILMANLPEKTTINLVTTNIASRLSIVLPILKTLQEKRAALPDKKSPADNKSRKKGDNKFSETLDSIDEEGIFVQFAGIVLVHPFLHSLFKRIELIKEGKFETLYAQQKALYLLHYLATNNVFAEEFELAVPKLLCNWPLELPVEKNIELTDSELREADDMLSAVIEQWVVLKNTSIAGLREGFLMRNGKISKSKDQLHLLVESKSIDLLLDQLPWNLSLIKLPWMKELLRIEWR